MMRIYDAATLISLMIACTANGGERVVVDSGEIPNHPQQPQVVVDAQGRIHLTIGRSNEILYCRSGDGGKTFSTPMVAGSVNAISLGMRRGPRISVFDRRIVISAIGGKVGRGRDGDLLVWHSADDGASWHGPVQINDVAESAREGLHAMAGDSSGSTLAVWLDLRTKKTELYGSISSDGGATWSKNRLIYRSPDGSICECCHPSVAFDSKGNPVVLWRNSLAGNRDMYLAESKDGGISFSAAAMLGNGNWKLKACPMDGGAVAVQPSGQITTAWRRGSSIFRASASEPGEKLLGNGEQPWVAANAEGSFVVWTTRSVGDLLLHRPNSAKPERLTNLARHPVIATPTRGGGPVVVAWEAVDERRTNVVVQVIEKVK